MPLGGFAPLPLRLGGDVDGWTADQHARACADLVSLKRTSAFAIIHYSTSASGVTLLHYFSQPAIGVAYAPTSTFNGTGDVTWTWANAYEDPYGVSYPVQIRAAKVTVQSASDRGAFIRSLSVTAVRAICHDLSSGSATNETFLLKVW